MKKSLLLLAFLFSCTSSKPVVTSNIILSSDSKARAIMIDNVTLKCAFIKEWNVSATRSDNKKEGCWCMFPPFNGELSGGVLVVFRLMQDSMCTEKETNSSEQTEEGLKL